MTTGVGATPVHAIPASARLALVAAIVSPTQTVWPRSGHPDGAFFFLTGF